ncbi:MAG: mraW [Mycobacterium sp.]|nr:mraW [Mycobacterium sp.]MCW2743897.1 mraW [Mycobacterium sp.]
MPVLLERITELLLPALTRGGDSAPAVFVDCTLGLGGHSEAVLAAAPSAILVGLDRDPAALAVAAERLAPFGDRVRLVQAVYDELPEVLEDLALRRVQAVLFDLGLSSLQIDDDSRGFAYARDTPLDMRMSRGTGRTAADIVNTYAVGDLARVLREYGEERFALRVARAIAAEREREPFTGTARLAEVVRDAVPAATRRTGGHPAKRAFQALRIEVNDELAVLDRALPAAVDALAVGGRIAVLSYHSLEDRRVKRVLAAGTTSSAPVDMPVPPPESEPYLRPLTRGAEKPGPAEIAANPRAASARLRAAERIRDAA